MVEKINCYICGSKAEKIAKNFPGYVQGIGYDIFKCEECDTHFIKQDEIDLKVYDLIYSEKNIVGYERYFYFAETVKKVENPLYFLAKEESTYFPIFDYLKDKKNLKILEIGCGYGYLTYSMKKMGHQVIGIDLSKNAIEYAKKNLGDNYFNSSFEDFSVANDEKFDLIVSTEVIEHVREPLLFIENAFTMLKNDGSLLLTTPNKDYSASKTIWNSDLAPVHLFWFCRKSFECISSMKNLNYKFVDFRHYYPLHENKFIKYFRFQTDINTPPLLTSSGKLAEKWSSKKEPFFRSIIKWFLLDLSLVRNLSNYFFNMLINKDITLCVVLKKNER